MDCELNSLNLPIVGEINHIVGDCYCYLCTCGIHICPSNPSYEKALPKDMYSTLYSRSYLPKTKTPMNTIIREGELMHSKQQMDLTTTQRSTYKPYEYTYEARRAPRCYTLSPFKATARSTYRTNFPDWQSYEKTKELPQAKYCGSPIKFTSVSTYGNDFTQYSIKDKGKKTVIETPSLIGAKNAPTGKTMNQISYTPYKVQPFIRRRNISDGEIMAKGSISMQTTYREAFVPTNYTQKLLTKKKLNKIPLA